MLANNCATGKMTTISLSIFLVLIPDECFHHAPGALLQMLTCAGGSNDNKQRFVSSRGHSYCNREWGKRLWRSTDEDWKGPGLHLGNRREKRKQNITVALVGKQGEVRA
jgi:hypothetical protein